VNHWYAILAVERLVNNPLCGEDDKQSSLWRGWGTILPLKRLVNHPPFEEACKPSSLWRG
jgi:hypothetical protein